MRAATPKQAPAALPIDTVFVSITRVVECDFERRGVFPEIRSTSPACIVHYGDIEHRITPALAAVMLEDAKLQHTTSEIRGARAAYRSLVRRLESGLEDSTERRATSQSPTAYLKRDDGYSETWCGTKQQLIDKGIRLAKWPEAGQTGKQRNGVDWRGLRTTVDLLSPHWPDYFEAWVSIPTDQRRPDPEDVKKEAEHAKRSLANMLASSDEFREKLIAAVRYWAEIAIKTETAGHDHSKSQHGYSLDAESLDDIRMSLDAFAEAVLRAEVRFDAVLHAKVAERHRAAIAASDDGFQAHIASLVRSAPALLRGEAQ